jgi:putative hemolysin
VARDTLDNVVGVIRGKELLSLAMEGKPFDFKKTFRTPLFVLETTPAVKVMELFKKSKMHIGFVVDEYGTIQGLVTFGDILRSVFEDVEDTVEGEREIVKREDGSLLISGSLALDEFMDYMEIVKLSDDEHTGINTIGGFVMAQLGAVPLEGQHFEWNGLKFEVVDMDGRRVDKILVSRIKDNKETES